MRDLVVLKLGGSLFDLPDLGQRFVALCDAWNSLSNTRSLWLIVPGGGEAADLVRNWDQLHRLGDVPSHHLAIWSLSLTARFLVEVLPQCQLASSRDEASAAWNENRHAILDVPAFMQVEEAGLPERTSHSTPISRPLPASWETTSDSIAAWIALRWPATTLLLAKSTKPAASPLPAAHISTPNNSDAEQQMQQGTLSLGQLAPGVVDAHFLSLANSIKRVAWVDLRHNPQDIRMLQTISPTPSTVTNLLQASVASSCSQTEPVVETE